MAKVPKWANVTSVSDLGKDLDTQSTETAQDILEKLKAAAQEKEDAAQEAENAVENNYVPSDRGMAILRAYVEKFGRWAGAEVLHIVTGFDMAFCAAFINEAFPAHPHFNEVAVESLLEPLVPECLIKDGVVVFVSETAAFPAFPAEAGRRLHASPDAEFFEHILVNKGAKDLDDFYVCVVDNPAEHCAIWALDAHTYVALKISGGE